MERIYIGVYFANEDVKGKFLEASKCRLGKINSYNENGKLFTYTTDEGQELTIFMNSLLLKKMICPLLD